MNQPTWITFIGFATKAVMLVLIVLSVWSVTVMLERKKRLKTTLYFGDVEKVRAWIKAGNHAELERFSQEDSTLLGRAFREIFSSPKNPESIAYALTSFLGDERKKLSVGLSVLATLGSNAPFIGLFGTVLGIIQSFGALATTDSAMNTVIFSLAEALIATAVGLFVAIPAVIAFNFYSNQIRNAIQECESLRDLYLSRFIYGR